jgi:uncharacterized protein Smg (DUF494 family)
MDLVVLVAEMSQGNDRSYQELDAELTTQGYTPAEIEQAVFWFSSLREGGDVEAGLSGDTVPRIPITSHGVAPVRVLSSFERMSIPAESYGFLLRLLNLGILSLDQFEQIVTRAIPVGPEKIQVADVKDIACTVLFNKEPESLEDDFFDVFEDEESAT